MTDAVAPAPTEVVIPYVPRPLQRALHRLMRQHRFGVVVAHRRFGKTIWGVNHLLRAALTCPRPRPRVAYLAPTFRMAKQISWDYLQFFARVIPGVTFNASELRCDLPNGGQVRLYGADSPDSLRGIYLDGVVLDEFGMMQSNVFSEVVRPALSDRVGWACFVGTPAGRNQFWDLLQVAQSGEPGWFARIFKASETGLLPAEELATAHRVMSEDEYRQEFEASFEASIRGSIYGKELAEMRDAGRIGVVPYDPALPVHTAWDLGMADHTVIWCYQSLRGGEVRLIDYYEAEGESLAHYLAWLQRRPYVWGRHWAPHDIRVRELGTGKSRLEVAAALGLKFEVTPDIGLEDGIAAVRMMLARTWVDEGQCRAGLDQVMTYRRSWNTAISEFKAMPVHDQASHAADALRMLAVAQQAPKEPQVPRVRQPFESMSPPGTGWMA